MSRQMRSRRRAAQPPLSFFFSGSAPAVGAGAGCVDQPRLQLLFDLLEIVRLRLQIARMRPLEPRLERSADFPVGIAEVVVDGRICWLEFDCTVELLHRFFVIPEAIVSPASESTM